MEEKDIKDIPAPSIDNIAGVINEVVDKLSNTGGIVNAAVIVYADVSEGDGRRTGFMSKTINLARLEANTLFLADYIHSLIVSKLPKEREDNKNVEKKEKENS